MVGRGDYKVQCVTTFVGRFTYVLLQAMVIKDVIQLYSTGVWWHVEVNVKLSNYHTISNLSPISIIERSDKPSLTEHLCSPVIISLKRHQSDWNCSSVHPRLHLCDMLTRNGLTIVLVVPWEPPPPGPPINCQISPTLFWRLNVQCRLKR